MVGFDYLDYDDWVCYCGRVSKDMEWMCFLLKLFLNRFNIYVVGVLFFLIRERIMLF